MTCLPLGYAFASARKSDRIRFLFTNKNGVFFNGAKLRSKRFCDTLWCSVIRYSTHLDRDSASE